MQQEGLNSDSRSQSAINPAVHADIRRARRYFEHGDRAVEGGLFDRALESYIQGLTFHPENIKRHKVLQEIGQKRQKAGHKAAGFFSRLSRSRGQTPLQRLLNTEFLWATDPENASLALRVMTHAIECELDDLAYWAGTRTMELNAQGKPDRSIYLGACDLFEKIGALHQAIDCLKRTMPLAGVNPQLIKRLAGLETRLSASTSWEESDDDAPVETEDDLLFLSAEGGTRSKIEAEEREIARLRTAFERDPKNLESIDAYALALGRSGRSEMEEQALSLLNDSYQRLGQYRLKMLAGDVQILRFDRIRRGLRAKLDRVETPEHRAQIRQKLRTLAEQQLQFELQEFNHRVDTYPEDSGLHLELAKRLEAAGDVAHALDEYRMAGQDPEIRPRALGHIGQLLSEYGRHDEAIKALREGLDLHATKTGPLHLAMRYELMIALTGKARQRNDHVPAEEACELARQIVQENINYKQVRQHLQDIERLLEDFKNASNGAAA